MDFHGPQDMEYMTKKLSMLAVGIFFLVLLLVVVYGETVAVSDTTVCCDKTKQGLYCQDVKKEDCSTEGIPTACESTAFCKGGYCYDSVEGTCLDNVPQMVCNDNNGTWTETKPPQCELGCCILGDQASFVTLVRCKRLSALYDLETNFNSNIKDEVQCILTARAEEKGACVFYEDFEKGCRFVKRSECVEGITSIEEAPVFAEGEGELVGAPAINTSRNASGVQASPEAGGVEFHPGVLCSSEELGTVCGLTQKTTCIDGKEEVYFVDTCGNPANIYDSRKVNDKSYWANVVDKQESCNPSSGNADSQTCGNCNYLFGSYCRETSSESINPTYGENYCADLNCPAGEVTGGKDRLHGESWCLYASSGKSGGGNANVGSKFYRYLCINGQVTTEPCADFRQEVCIEDSIDTTLGEFSQAACRVNRWQDCTAQDTKKDCENEDQRDCKWLDGIQFIIIGANATSIEGMGQALQGRDLGKENLGGCVPDVPPGLSHWAGEDSAAVCSQANAVCPVTYEKGLTGGGWKCVENCECLEESLQNDRAQLCSSLGDCGQKVNWVGKKGYGEGVKITDEEVEEE